jgi:hypothetical protein
MAIRTSTETRKSVGRRMRGELMPTIQSERVN